MNLDFNLYDESARYLGYFPRAAVERKDSVFPRAVPPPPIGKMAKTQFFRASRMFLLQVQGRMLDDLDGR